MHTMAMYAKVRRMRLREGLFAAVASPQRTPAVALRSSPDSGCVRSAHPLFARYNYRAMTASLKRLPQVLGV